MAGKQKFKEDVIGALTKFSTVTVQLANSLVTLGGLQYNTGVLSLSTNINGAGGLDTGSVQVDTAYYVYIVLNSGTPALVCSLSGSQPSGFDISVKVGGFFTDSGTAIIDIADFKNNGTLELVIPELVERYHASLTVQNANIIAINVVGGENTTGVLVQNPILSGGDFYVQANEACEIYMGFGHNDTNNAQGMSIVVRANTVMSVNSVETTLDNALGGGSLNTQLGPNDNVTVSMSNQSTTTSWANLLVRRPTKTLIG